MDKINFNKIKDFLFRKEVFILALIVVFLVLFVVFRSNNAEDITISQSIYGDLSQTVRATGTVTSKTDLNLSFNKQGTVKSVKVEVGNKVYLGQVLATLDANDAYGDVTKARGALLAAEAKLKSVVEGASSEEVSLAKVLLENAKRDFENTNSQQITLVKNAFNNLLNSSLEAVNTESNSNTTPPTISGNYSLGKEGTININIYNSGDGMKFFASGAVTGLGNVSSTTAQAIGNSGLFILFSSTTNINNTNWTISIPNKKASNYVANENAYQSALRTQQSALSSAQSLIDQRTAELAVKQASARGSEIDLAQADVVSAQGGLQKAQASYEDNIVRAPANGTITKVDVKYGEQADAGKTAIVLQDVENLYVEALINESNIASIKLGQKVNITFDALSKIDVFTGTVSHIDPSSVTEDGVVNFKIKVTIDEKSPEIRPGMNAEITVIALEKNNVISVPKAGVIVRDSKSYVHVITDEKKKKYTEVEVITGITGDGNLVEIVSGLSQDAKIAIVASK